MHAVRDWSDLRAALASRSPVDDADFDRIYPAAVRHASRDHWTPARVAARAADLLATRREARVLDVGAGVGKFCIIGAARARATFVGIEHRPHLVAMARAAAEQLAVPTEFVEGGLEEIRWESFDGYYLYNPFYEHLCPARDRFDATVELSGRRFRIDVERTIAGLERAPLGARVVTYHGFGGPMPSQYVRLGSEKLGTAFLELWEKRARSVASSSAAEKRRAEATALRQGRVRLRRPA